MSTFVKVVRGQSLRTRSLEAILGYTARSSEGDTGALTKDAAGVATNRFVLGKWLSFKHTPS
jgi:hypothetical protein